MHKIFSFFLLIFMFFGIAPKSYANINLTVSPIKYEIDVLPGVTITKTAKLINHTPNDYTILTGKSDFTTNGPNGKPKFVRRSELAYPDQQLSEWVTISTPSFFIPAKSEKEITFNIDIPANATPGGHYGAIFFKNNHVGGGSNQIGLNIDYGVLILINVAGEIVTEGEVDDIVVRNSRSKGVFQRRIDDCFLDLTESNFDGICYELPFGFGKNTPEDNKEKPTNPQQEDSQTDTSGTSESQPNNNQNTPLTQNNPTDPEESSSGDNSELTSNQDQQDNQEDLDLASADEKSGVESVDVITSFDISFKNVGNTHLKPTGKITLVDEEGRQIKGIGKKYIYNDGGVIIDEQIVNYLAVNDIGGNVLPYSQRIFTTDWHGFPYKGYDEEGNPEVKYWSPSEYYTNKNMKENPVIMPWERILKRYNTKKITANIEVTYTDKNGEDIVYNSAREILVSYEEEYVGMNYNVILPTGVVGFFIFLILLFRRKKKVKCISCKKKIEKDMKICPYCETKQHKQKEKKKNKKKNKKKDILN